jgi:hypothetical protein
MDMNITITIGGPSRNGSSTDAAGDEYPYDSGNDDLYGRYRKSQQDLADSLNYLLDALNGNQQNASDQCCEHHHRKHRHANPIGNSLLGGDASEGPQGPLGMLMMLLMILQKLMQMQQDGGDASLLGDGGRNDLRAFGDSMWNLGDQIHQQDLKIAQRYGIPLN